MPESSQCPSCGSNDVSRVIGTACISYTCQACGGTFVGYSQDRRQPEGGHTQDFSRRRSLPALAKLRQVLTEHLDEARAMERVAKTFQLSEEEHGIAASLVPALEEVISFINGRLNEEPEGNTEVR